MEANGKETDHVEGDPDGFVRKGEDLPAADATMHF